MQVKQSEIPLYALTGKDGSEDNSGWKDHSGTFLEAFEVEWLPSAYL